MFREMRRGKQQLTSDECIEILKEHTSGVLALLGDDGYPYAVPLNYVYHDSKLYFHGAMTGHKYDSMIKNSKASFCVIDRDDLISNKFTTAYKSVIVFGKMRIIDNADEKRNAITILTQRLSDEPQEARDAEIELFFNALCSFELDIEHMTGKQGKELMK